ncbi:thiol-disulfide oxidoreductase DCC family protein [Spirillospora sp. CA-294931]|uniref:thiol-disulfide oxidoreductase DCC family protein n=1 Tax=Spirillospora sp. CA-294931 TaxID=3240042 RepID=UPI003D90611B
MTTLERPVLVYDGDCGFCTSSVRFLERRVPTEARVVPFQFADLDALGTTAERAEYEVLWVDRKGRVFGGAQAVSRLLTGAGGLWRLLGAVIRVPPVRWVAQGVYRLIARNRHRMPGGTAACALPAAQRPGAGESG